MIDEECFIPVKVATFLKVCSVKEKEPDKGKKKKNIKLCKNNNNTEYIIWKKHKSPMLDG